MCAAATSPSYNKLSFHLKNCQIQHIVKKQMTHIGAIHISIFDAKYDILLAYQPFISSFKGYLANPCIPRQTIEMCAFQGNEGMKKHYMNIANLNVISP